MLMRLIRWLLLTKEIVSKTGELHFRRWRLLQTPLFGLYVHNILKSDEDKDPHDHPWWFVTLVLAGGYFEDRVSIYGDAKSHHVHDRWSVASCRTTEFHKIRLMGPTWTLVLTGPRIHDLWGYLTPLGWVDHKTYRRKKNEIERSLVHKD